MEQNSEKKVGVENVEEQVPTTDTCAVDSASCETDARETAACEVKADEPNVCEAPSAEEKAEATETPAETTEQEESEERTPEEDEERLRAVDIVKLAAEELLDHLDEMITKEFLPEFRQLNRLKKLINEKEKEAKEALMIKFINLQTRFKELEAKKEEEEKNERLANLEKKRELVDRLRALLTSTDDEFTVRNEFLNIRSEWKNTGAMPQNERRKVIEEYAELIEEFYKINKIDTAEKEKDFRENREAKEALIQRAKELQEKKNVIRAFEEGQELLDEWKETGPVAPEFSDALWHEFDEAITAVNKRHDDHFKKRHEQEEANYQRKLEIVEELENMLITLPTTRDEWRTYERKMDKIRKEWRKSGRVPKSKLNDIRHRYRIATDEFYLQRRAFMKELSAHITPRLERLRELADEAEALQYSTDWRQTTKELQAMQAEWTEVSKLGTRVAEAQRLWKRFRGACDTFFDRKAEQHKERMANREENYEAKLEIVERLEALIDQNPEDPSAEIAEIEKEWRSIGLVPNDKKDELLNRYFGGLRQLRGENRGRGGGRGGNRRQNEPRKPRPVNLDKDLGNLSDKELEGEHSNIQKNLTLLREELLQYETNIEFFNASPDNPMVMHIQNKIDDLKKQIAQLEERTEEVKEEYKSNDSNEE